jgi:hypothetical protein
VQQRRRLICNGGVVGIFFLYLWTFVPTVPAGFGQQSRRNLGVFCLGWGGQVGGGWTDRGALAQSGTSANTGYKVTATNIPWNTEDPYQRAAQLTPT